MLSQENGVTKRVKDMKPSMEEDNDMMQMDMDHGDESQPDNPDKLAAATDMEVEQAPEVAAKPWSEAQETSANSGNDWFAACSEAKAEDTEASPTNTAAHANAAGRSVPVDAEGQLQIFWLDAFEDSFNSPGTVYLFGKVAVPDTKDFASCCVQVKNLERNVYVLPREYKLDAHGMETSEPVNFMDVYKEMDQICKSKGITKFKVKQVDRLYAFEERDVPASTKYLKLKYAAESPALPHDLQGSTFKMIFGASTSCLELLTLKRKLMGPCWLSVKQHAVAPSQLSWCKYEVVVTDQKAIVRASDQPPAPPLTVMSLHLTTVLNGKHSNEVVLASALIHKDVSMDGATRDPKAISHFSVVRKLDNQIWPWDFQRTVKGDKSVKLEICASERALLAFLIAKVHQVDPDVLVGHNFAGFDLHVLLHRMQAAKIPHWSKIGRLRRNNMPRLSSAPGAFGGGSDAFVEWQVVSGRLLCDTYLQSKELLHERSYSLKELAKSQLGATKPDLEVAEVPKYFEETGSLMQLVRHCENDAFLSLQLMFKLMVLPLTKQLTNLAGNLWSRSLRGARAERIEYLLLHEFHKLKYVVPDKLTRRQKAEKDKKNKANQDDLDGEGGGGGGEEDGNEAASSRNGRKKPAYAGGLVLDPKRGFYDQFVVLLDFNSLYPSIVQEYNVCFTTVERPLPNEDGTLPLADLPSPSADQGVLPRLIKTLVDRRREVKQLLKNEKDAMKALQYDIRQKALKIMANSMYGCLGFTGARFYARPLAELITAKGRDSLMHTVEIASANGMEVVYGDTDSIFINTGVEDLKEARDKANLVKREVNKLYRCLEIDIDGIFKTMLLLKKKKYAALTVAKDDGRQVLATTRETKGLDLVRRDWCVLSREVGSYVLDVILSGKGREEVVSEIHEHLRSVADKVRKNELGIEKYMITKQLTKAPQDYPDAKNQAHVQVALRQIQQGVQVPAGATIEYVICVDEGKTSMADRAHHPKTVLKADGMLQVDVEWYLAQQIHPPIARLCEVIDGTDAAQIAECLGLDASKFHSASSATADQQDSLLGTPLDDEDRFKACTPLMVRCAKCATTAAFEGVLGQASPEGTKRQGSVVLQCASCGERYKDAYLSNILGLAIRAAVKTYYTGPLVCEDVLCGAQTRGLSAHVGRDDSAMPLFPSCVAPTCRSRMRKQETDAALHTQLIYLKNLFDVEWATKRTERRNKGRPAHKAETFLPPAPGTDNAVTFEALRMQVDEELQRSAYHNVDIGRLFKPLEGSIALD